MNLIERIKKGTLTHNLYDYWSPEKANEFFEQKCKELDLVDWTFEIVSSREKSNIGRCFYGPKKITMQDRFFFALTATQIQDVILHELAHALSGYEAAHGPIWKAAARRLGCRPRSCTEVAKHPGFMIPWMIPVGQKWKEVVENNGFVTKKVRVHKPTKQAISLYLEMYKIQGVREVGFALEFESRFNKSFNYGLIQYKLCREYHHKIVMGEKL